MYYYNTARKLSAACREGSDTSGSPSLRLLSFSKIHFMVSHFWPCSNSMVQIYRLARRHVGKEGRMTGKDMVLGLHIYSEVMTYDLMRYLLPYFFQLPTFPSHLLFGEGVSALSRRGFKMVGRADGRDCVQANAL